MSFEKWSIFFSTKYMAHDAFSEPPRRADSRNSVFNFFFLLNFWVQVTSGAQGRLLSVTNAIQADTWRQGDSGWAQAGRPGGLPPFQCIPAWGAGPRPNPTPTPAPAHNRAPERAPRPLASPGHVPQAVQRAQSPRPQPPRVRGHGRQLECSAAALLFTSQVRVRYDGGGRGRGRSRGFGFGFGSPFYGAPPPPSPTPVMAPATSPLPPSFVQPLSCVTSSVLTQPNQTKAPVAHRTAPLTRIPRGDQAPCLRGTHHHPRHSLRGGLGLFVKLLATPVPQGGAMLHA